MDEKIEASLMLASYFETLGFKNGLWEFNYNHNINTFNDYNFIWNTMLNHYTILGGSFNINIKNWFSSDDTILIIATAEALLLNDSIENKYIKKYISVFDKLNDNKRISGMNTLYMISLLKKGYKLNNLPTKSNMGGNGAAMRTGPIGLYYYNNYEKVIEESMIASRLTHNYYLGFMGGVITALFTAFAINNIPPWKWIDELFKQYDNIIKYYPKTHKISYLDEYMDYWQKYNETRVSKIKYKNSLDMFIYSKVRISHILSYHPNDKIKKYKSLDKLKFDWSKLCATGLDVCIYAYDCLLLSMYTPNSELLDFNNIKYNLDTFMTLVCIHPGDNDTTATIGGTWFGALCGYSNFDKNRLSELEFYNLLVDITTQLKSKIN
jgi:ADP-ribosylarginine hydrolase